MTHAMVISGVHVDEKTGRALRFKVENSWGEDVGQKGWFVMSEEWFDEYVFFSLRLWFLLLCEICVNVDSSTKSSYLGN
jgi:aminopeptidase C